MIAKIAISEFRNRLETNTKIGDPNIKGSPLAVFSMFGQINKKFYGDFDSSNFKLTKNSSLFPIPYVIKGKYKSNKRSETVISYEIKPIWFGYLWIRIVPILALFSFNISLASQRAPTEEFLILNLFVLIMFLLVNLIIKIKKKKLKKDFRKIFEIID
jgi:hypothetical protein